MNRELFKVMLEADNGTGDGAPAPEVENAGNKTVTLTQDEVDAMIARAIAKGAKKAQKDLEKVQKAGENAASGEELSAEAERLRSEREAFEREKMELKAKTMLSGKGMALEDSELNSLVVSMLCDKDEKVAERKLTALEKLIEQRVNTEVDRRLGASSPNLPGTGKNDGNNSINALLRSAARNAKKN